MDTSYCIIIPTYNNMAFLPSVLDSLASCGMQVIVVSDGATDTTVDFLENLNLPYVLPVIYKPNRGKANALCVGFAKALEMGFRYAITMDSDGQHLPKDLPKFLDCSASNPRALIIGARSLKQDNKPGKNSFANSFSNFWFSVQTLSKAPDTQSGYRLYPIYKMGRMKLLSKRYDGELEMLVRSAWRGIPIESVSIDVYYPPQGVRITHFRPFMDFFRISLLNTLLCILAIVYYYPKKALEAMGL